MKKLAITIGLLAGATAGYSQGQLNWTDYVSADSSSHPPIPAFSIEIWGAGTETPGTGTYPNNTANDLPAGSATYSGTQLGAGFEIGLYDSTTPVVSLVGTPLAVDTFTTANSAPGIWDFSGSLTATDPLNASGTAVYVELAAWSTAQGATSYAQALAQGVAAGASGASTGTTVLGGGGSPPATPGTLTGIGLQDFQLTSTIPEPSTVALGVIGASTFLMRLRRKQ